MIYQRVGTLMLASRMKRLGDRLFTEITRIYKLQGIDFEPSWFPVFYLLDRDQIQSVSAIAREMGVTDSAVSQLIRQLKERDLISHNANQTDRRAGHIRLTDLGQKLLETVKPIWHSLETVMDEILIGGPNGSVLLNALSELETELNQQELSSRVQNKLEWQLMKSCYTISPLHLPHHEAWLKDMLLTYAIAPHPHWGSPGFLNKGAPEDLTDNSFRVLIKENVPVALLSIVKSTQTTQTLGADLDQIVFCGAEKSHNSLVEDFFICKVCQDSNRPVVIYVKPHDRVFLHRLKKIGFSLFNIQPGSTPLNSLVLIYDSQNKEQ